MLFYMAEVSEGVEDLRCLQVRHRFAMHVAAESSSKSNPKHLFYTNCYLSHLSPHLLQKYDEVKMDLIRTERHILKEMGFICHVEHPHKFILLYLQNLDAPRELMQEAWSLANDR